MGGGGWQEQGGAGRGRRESEGGGQRIRVGTLAQRIGPGPLSLFTGMAGPELSSLLSQVVYQEGEKTAQVLERCSRRSLRSRPGRTVSAKEFLNRAVLSGIDNNTEHPDELMEMGLL